MVDHSPAPRARDTNNALAPPKPRFLGAFVPSTMPVPSLPHEVLDYILGYLPLSDLTSASLLCHTWQARVFPRLYNTVYLSRAAQLELFSKRITLGHDHGALSITANLEGLVLYAESEEDYEVITQPMIGYLKTIIPRFHRLRRLCWDLDFMPNYTEIFRLFQTTCPRLESVNLSFGPLWYATSEWHANVFGFRNLSEFTLNVTLLASNGLCFRGLASLIASSPNLASLSIELFLREDVNWDYCPSSLVTAFDDGFAVPRLHTFRARGSANPDWARFFREDSHPLRAFFVCQYDIKNLALGWVSRSAFPDQIDAMLVAQLFPSLKHFEGPAFLCNVIVGSSLAAQLESLVIVDHTLGQELHDFSLMELSEAVTTLPRLRRLAIWAENLDGIDILPLETFANASDMLEELEIRSSVGNYTEFLDILSQLPELRCLTLTDSIFASPEYNDGGKDEGEEGNDDIEQPDWEQLVLKLARVCPGLVAVRKWHWGRTLQLWEVVWRSGEELRVVQRGSVRARINRF